MEQIATPTRSRFFQVRLLAFITLLICGSAISVMAQQQPYILLQGPTEKKTYRFMKGQELTVRLQGEVEFFTARIIDLFPESQTIRLDDMIISTAKIAELRHRKRSAGMRSYLQIQGAINLALIGGFSAFPSEDRDNQKNFLIGTAIASAVMILAGSFGKYATHEFGPNSRYLLKIAGGDLREGDGG